MYAQLVQQLPDGKDWLYEVKFDGYRIQAQIEGGKVSLLSRRGLGWTDKYRTLSAAPDPSSPSRQAAAPRSQ